MHEVFDSRNMKSTKLYIRSLILALALGFSFGSAYAEPAESRDISHTVGSPAAQVRVLGGRIEISIQGDEDCPVTIYALTGQVVKTLNAQPGVTVVELPKGYYIVKCDRVSTRVVVK